MDANNNVQQSVNCRETNLDTSLPADPLSTKTLHQFGGSIQSLLRQLCLLPQLLFLDQLLLILVLKVLQLLLHCLELGSGLGERRLLLCQFCVGIIQPLLYNIKQRSQG